MQLEQNWTDGKVLQRGPVYPLPRPFLPQGFQEFWSRNAADFGEFALFQADAMRLLWPVFEFVHMALHESWMPIKPLDPDFSGSTMFGGCFLKSRPGLVCRIALETNQLQCLRLFDHELEKLKRNLPADAQMQWFWIALSNFLDHEEEGLRLKKVQVFACYFCENLTFCCSSFQDATTRMTYKDRLLKPGGFRRFWALQNLRCLKFDTCSFGMCI